MGAEGVQNFCKAPISWGLHNVKMSCHFLFFIFYPMGLKVKEWPRALRNWKAHPSLLKPIDHNTLYTL